MNKKMEPSLQYACKRILELEQLLLVDVPETVWPAEVAWFCLSGKRRRTPGASPAPTAAPYQPHVAGKMPVPSIIAAARSLASAMEKYA
jgi:hypothetical protein